jgi:hypothetical protein
MAESKKNIFEKLKTYNGESAIEDDMLDIKEDRDIFVSERLKQLNNKDYSEIEFCKIGGEKHEKKQPIPRPAEPPQGGEGLVETTSK